MPSSFSKYTGGIAPVQGLFEMGASIGKNYAAGINAAAENITKGIGDYYKMVGEAQYADSELDSAGKKYTALASMLGSEPETAHLVEGITPILETIKKGRSGSHNAKLAAVAEVGAQGKALNETFGYLNLYQNAKFRRIYEEGLLQPPEGEETKVISFGANPDDTRWSPNLSYNANVDRVSGNYDRWLEQNADAIKNGKLKVIPKQTFLAEWKKRLPSVIQAHPKMTDAQKAHALDILSRNQFYETINVDEDPRFKGLLGVVEFDQNWDTINSYVGSGASPSVASRAAGAPNGAMATPTPQSYAGGWNPQAVKLRDENERLNVEAKALQDKIGTTWFGYGDDARRARLAEIQKTIIANSEIIKSLGGAPSSAEINKAQASRSAPIPRIILSDEAPAEEAPVAPEKVAEPVVVAPPVVIAPPAAVAPAKVAEPSAPVTPPAAPAKKTNAVSNERSTANIIANEELAVEKFNKQQEADFRSGTPELKKIKLGSVDGMIGNVLAKYNVNLGEFRRLNPWFQHEDDFATFEKSGRRVFNQKYADKEIIIPVRRGVPKKITSVDELPDEIKNRLIKQNGRLSDPSQRRKQQAVPQPEIPQPVDVSREAPISREEAEGGIPPEDAGTPPPKDYIDSDTGNVVINTPITGIKSPDDQLEEQDGGLDTGTFAPIKLRPLGTGKPLQAPKLPEGTKANYTQDEIDDLKVARMHLEETKADLISQNNSVKPAIDYLQRIRKNVLNGDASSVDFGIYGEWQKAHPDAATAISVGTQAAALWIGGGWAKTGQIAEGVSATNYAAKRLEEARKITEKVIDGKMRKFGRALTDEEIGESVAFGLRKANLASKELIAGDAAKFGEAIRKSTAKSMFWETLALELAGAPDSSYSIPDTAHSDVIRGHLKDTLAKIRQIRTVNGGNSQWVPFGWNDTKITAAETQAIRQELDTQIKNLSEIHASNQAQIDTLNKNATPENLLKLAQNLRTDSNAKLAAIEIAKTNGIPLGDENLDEDISVGSRPIASREIVIPQSNEKKKEQMKAFMKAKLGYVPAAFEDAWRKQFPESTLQVKETPYGAFYTDGKGEWKQVNMGSSGKQLQPHEIAANKAVQFGQLKEDGTYEPTEFIAGSGIKLGGLGAFGTPSDATKFRTEYAKKIRAVQIADEIRKMNEITFRSFMPSEWGKAQAKTTSLIAQLRTELIGVGSVSDFEQKLLKDLVSNPTDFFRLQSTVRANYEELISRLSQSLIEEPQQYGLDVQMPKDKSAMLRNMQLAYRAQQERYKEKMAQYDKANPRK